MEEIRRTLETIEDRIRLCESVGKALVEVGESVTARWFEKPSDYQRLRRELLIEYREVEDHLQKLREKQADPELIRAHSGVRQLHRPCERCLKHNQRKNVEENGFRCLILEGKGPATRFLLDSKGDVVEHE